MFSGSGAPRSRTSWEWHSQGQALPLRVMGCVLKARLPVSTSHGACIQNAKDRTSPSRGLSHWRRGPEGSYAEPEHLCIPGLGLEGDLSGDPSLPPATGDQPLLAARRAQSTCLFVTNLCSCLVLNFSARCLVISGVSFGSTPAGDRGTPSSAPPVPFPPCSPHFRGWRGGQDGPRTRCMCLPPAICLGALSPLAFLGMFRAWAPCQKGHSQEL